MGQHLRIRSCGLALALSLLVAGSSPAYLNNGNWLSTATDNAVPPIGRPITLTWSIVPDGTNVSHLGKPSNLVSVFDSIFPGSVGVALEEKPWFDLVEQCFDRWSVLSGLTLTYEPADDGLTNHAHGVWAGELGERGDIRLAGATTSSSSTLAEAGFIPNADITFNTTQTAYFSAPGGSFPYINLRTTLMHEIGHSLGFGHSSSNNANFLMESFSQTNFDGPQFDDIRGVHYLYGDFNEKSNAGAGNESIATATPLGPLASGQSVTIGEHAGTGTLVLSSESDFVSIANSNDLDFYSFTIDGPSLVDLTLSPFGPTYNERGTVNSLSQSDLTLELYASGGGTPELLASANLNPTGQGESILDFALNDAGTYYARISGSTSAVQFYQLVLRADEFVLQGDFNLDGLVDAADYTLWRDNVGMADDSAINGRGDDVAGIDGDDFLVWKSHYGESFGMGGASLSVVPEPASFIGIALACSLIGGAQRQFRVTKKSCVVRSA
jgi:serralysin